MKEKAMRSSIVIMIGALALYGCGGRQDERQNTTAQSESSMPAQGQDPTMHGDMHGQGSDMAGGTGAHEMAGMCPMGVAGTSAQTEDTANGVAVVFTTTGDVNELRRRVAHMADMHNQHHAQPGHAGTMHGQVPAEVVGENGTGHGGSHGVAGKEGAAGKAGTAGGTTPSGAGQGGSHGIAGQSLTAEQQSIIANTEARAEDIEGGARLVFTPRDPGQLTTMRDQLRLHAQQMAMEQCPMMGHAMPGQTDPNTGTSTGTSQPSGHATRTQPPTR
jgi:hypothetical protein